MRKCANRLAPTSFKLTEMTWRTSGVLLEVTITLMCASPKTEKMNSPRNCLANSLPGILHWMDASKLVLSPTHNCWVQSYELLIQVHWISSPKIVQILWDSSEHSQLRNCNKRCHLHQSFLCGSLQTGVSSYPSVNSIIVARGVGVVSKASVMDTWLAIALMCASPRTEKMNSPRNCLVNTLTGYIALDRCIEACS